MIDSGGFEAFWKDDKVWTKDLHNRILSKTLHDIQMGFDLRPEDGIKPQLSAAASTSAIVLPVLHGHGPAELVSLASSLIEAQTNNQGIAVSERDCGRSLSDKASTVNSLRDILNGTDKRSILHILGCGDLASIALFAYLGADTFDSLTWLKFLIDEPNWQTRDFSQLDILKCECLVCGLTRRREYQEKVVLHNLNAYQGFLTRVRDWIKTGSIATVLEDRLKMDPNRFTVKETIN